MNKSSVLLSTALLSLSIATVAHAEIVYDNGGVTAGAEGNDATAWVQAEDFSFANDQILTGAGIYIAGFNGINNWNGNLDYWLFGSSNGTPSTVLASGSGANISTNATGSDWCCGGSSYFVSFDFGSEFMAASGLTYWLGIHLAPDFSIRRDLYWVSTATNATATGRESSGGTFNNWFNNTSEHAFVLYGNAASSTDVPEPDSALLIGLGLLGLGASMRRRFKAI